MLAEEVGFEPTDPSQGLLFSRQVQSAALPLFRKIKVRFYVMGGNSSRELFEEAKIVLGELANITDVGEEHGESLDAHSPSITGVLFGVDVACFENVGMNHSCTENFEPAGVFANAAAGTFTGNASDVDFKAGFYKGKVAGAVAGLDGLVEEFGEKFVEGGKEVGKGDVSVDVKPFNLMEEDMGAGGNVFVAEGAAGCDDANGWGELLHGADLDVGGVGAEEVAGVEIKGVLHVAGRMVGWEVESFKVVVVGVDVGAELDGKTHVGEDGGDAVEGLG